MEKESEKNSELLILLETKKQTEILNGIYQNIKFFFWLTIIYLTIIFIVLAKFYGVFDGGSDASMDATGMSTDDWDEATENWNADEESNY